MAQPKDPPLSARLPPAMLVELDAIAERRGLKRNAALKYVLGLGFAAEVGATPKAMADIAKTLASIPTRGPRTITEVRARAETPPFRGLTASGEALPKRRAYQKGQKPR